MTMLHNPINPMHLQVYWCTTAPLPTGPPPVCGRALPSREPSWRPGGRPYEVKSTKTVCSGRGEKGGSGSAS